MGKTAGSSIHCRLSPSLYHSGKGDSRCNSTTDHRPSAIADNVVKRVHLEPAPVDGGYKDFLITVRNPVDRIISWFYFLHPSYPPSKLLKHRRGCEQYSLFFQCWDSIQSLSENGLRPATEAVDDENDAGATNNDTTTTTQDASDLLVACRKTTTLAWDMVAGKRKCWHNYFNYNFTYGQLLHEATGQQQITYWNSNGSNGVEYNQNPNFHRRDRRRSNVTIYAIRTEHLEEDWTKINLMLGGSNDGVGKAGLSVFRKNDWTNESTIVPNKTLSAVGRLNLCRALCEEIQIYKKLLHLAVNIDEDGKKESLDELLRSCPMESREILTCPT